jgi:hypothetical protein
MASADPSDDCPRADHGTVTLREGYRRVGGRLTNPFVALALAVLLPSALSGMLTPVLARFIVVPIVVGVVIGHRRLTKLRALRYRGHSFGWWVSLATSIVAVDTILIRAGWISGTLAAVVLVAANLGGQWSRDEPDQEARQEDDRQPSAEDARDERLHEGPDDERA